jgi:hypothetical protein
VTRLVGRAVDAGVVRSDLSTTDVPLINFMLNTVVDLGRDVEPELYRRYLAIVLDGIRARGEEEEPLPVAPLDVPGLVKAIGSWKR